MSKEAMKLALETLEVWKGYMPALWDKTDEQAITAIREALAEQKSGIKQVIELYDSPDQPTQRIWVGLTDEEIWEQMCRNVLETDLCRAVEAKLKEKNT